MTRGEKEGKEGLGGGGEREKEIQKRGEGRVMAGGSCPLWWPMVGGDSL